MLVYKEVKKILNLPFEDYLKIGAESHSGLKSSNENGIKKEFVPTNKSKVGKLVDAIITGGEVDFSDPLYLAAKDIASKMKSEIGTQILSLLMHQISYTARIEEVGTGLSLKVKGRPDSELGKAATIDYKVNNSCKNLKDCNALIDWMGYDNQGWHYTRLGDKRAFFLFIYSTVTKSTFFLKRDLGVKQEAWWEEQVMMYGNIG